MYYVGIDLGTTNSVISTYDGKSTRVWKSPEQNDVTPSVIYINKRGGKMYGQSAYNNMARDPGNTASLFKRLMGTNTGIHFDCGIDMTPVECSTEILRTLFGYLPEEVREDSDTGVVITVPAAFNQMQKDATRDAAYDAHIRNVTLIQEPVAAIMTIASLRKIDGTFLVYDYGGGTFDVSIAQSTGKKANLLTNDGIQFCGGRDIDKAIYDEIVLPWLHDNFVLPADLRSNEKYSTLGRMAMWATEKAKIELSSNKNSVIRLDESEIRCTDEAGNEIYLDVSISRAQYEKILFPKVDATIKKVQDVISGAGLKAGDFECIVFIGGPTMYKPLRDYVCDKLGINPNIDVNPMTAVSEGAAIYAESVDFDSEDGGQKGDVTLLSSSTEHNLSLRYNSRTSADKAKIAVLFEGANTLNFVFTCVDTGWSSGVMTLKSESLVTVDLFNSGENRFSVQCTESNGTRVEIDEPRIVITKTAVNIGRIPSPHSVGVEIEDPISHEPKLDYLIRKDDLLPKSGKVTYKTTTTVSAGNLDNFISLKLWEGEIEDPVEFNRFVGDIKIDGASFDVGRIPVGSSVECEYTFNDSGNLKISVSIPSAGIMLKRDNFYNRQSAQIDFENDADDIVEEARNVYERIEEVNSSIYSKELDDVQNELGAALDKPNMDAEDLQALSELTQSGKGVVASFMRANKQELLRERLREEMSNYRNYESKATETQRKQVQTLEDSVERAIDANSSSAEKYLDELHGIVANLMFSDDETFKMIFYVMVNSPSEFTNPTLYRQYINEGTLCIVKDDIEGLRNVVGKLFGIMREQKGSDLDNIIKHSGITK